jgi:hypothetical protein
MKNITSSSQEGISTVGIEFELETNLDIAMADVRAKVDAAKMSLPQDVKSPVIQKVDIEGDSEEGPWYCDCEVLPQGGARGKGAKAAKSRKTVGKR